MKKSRLHIIQNRLLEIEKEIRSISLVFNNVLIEKAQLELERQFILDERNNWKSRMVWNVLVPIIVSLVTSFLIAKFYLK